MKTYSRPICRKSKKHTETRKKLTKSNKKSKSIASLFFQNKELIFWIFKLFLTYLKSHNYLDFSF